MSSGQSSPTNQYKCWHLQAHLSFIKQIVEHHNIIQPNLSVMPTPSEATVLATRWSQLLIRYSHAPQLFLCFVFFFSFQTPGNHLLQSAYHVANKSLVFHSITDCDRVKRFMLLLNLMRRLGRCVTLPPPPCLLKILTGGNHLEDAQSGLVKLPA